MQFSPGGFAKENCQGVCSDNGNKLLIKIIHPSHVARLSSAWLRGLKHKSALNQLQFRLTKDTKCTEEKMIEVVY